MKKLLTYIVLAVMLMTGTAMASELFNWEQDRNAPSANPTVIKTVTTTYTVLATDELVKADATSAGFVVTLPALSTVNPGKTLIVQKTDATANVVTVTAATGDTIEGQASRKLLATGKMYLTKLQSSTDWKVMWETPPVIANMATGVVYVGSSAVSQGSLGIYSAPTVSTTFTTGDCGKIIGVATDALTHVLPNSTAGCCFTFTNTGAAGANVIKIDVDADDQIFGTVTLASTVVAIAGAAGDSISLTKATSIRGDSITLCGVGGNVWNIISSTGIWADTN